MGASGTLSGGMAVQPFKIDNNRPIVTIKPIRARFPFVFTCIAVLKIWIVLVRKGAKVTKKSGGLSLRDLCAITRISLSFPQASGKKET